ncbi:MAG: tyrosine-type recombinase/integrase [Bacteroidales bacterium]|nr:tyrosine-type recombinase/integrase [Bacteroidales bacterium]
MFLNLDTEILTVFEDYLKYERRYSPHTVIAYISDLEEFFQHYKKEMFSSDLSLVDSKIIKHWLMTLKTEGFSPVTVNRKLSALRKFFKWAVSKGEIEKSPTEGIKNVKKPVRLPQFVPEEKMDNLLDNAPLFQEVDEGYRDRLILELFYDTGIRESELINIKCGDVDRKNLSITVHGKGNKTRMIPLSRELLEKLQPLFAGLDDYLFRTKNGKKMYAKLVYRIVKKYLETTESVTQNSPHILRHSFATALLNNGADINAIKELLGHANLQATQIYTHTTYEQLSKIYKHAHPRA